MAEEIEIKPGVIEKVKEVGERLAKVSGKLGEIQAIDIGDVEVIRIGRDILLSLPAGKEHFFVHTFPLGLKPADVKKIDEVV